MSDNVITLEKGRFDADWLNLRAPADRRARDLELAREACATLQGVDRPKVVDLGAGSGATLDALAAFLPADAEVTLADMDGDLLALAAAAHPSAKTLQVNLAAEIERVVAEADLVTGSAFLDLCSASFLERLADALPPRASVYFALSYDGMERRHSEAKGDGTVIRAFLRHQRRDKGFGPALGPMAAIHLAALLAGRGYQIRTAESPWELERERDGALMDALDAGIAAAAEEEGADVTQWRKRSPERSRTGHIDLLARPPA